MINIIFTPPILWALSSRISTHLLELLTCLYVLIIFKCCCSTSWAAAAAAATYSLFYGLFYTKLCLGDDTVVRMTQRNQGSQPPSATLTREWFPIERWTRAVSWEQLEDVTLKTAAASCHEVVAHVSLTPQQVKSACVTQKPAVTDSVQDWLISSNF